MTSTRPPRPPQPRGPALPPVLSGPRLDLVLVGVSTLVARAAAGGPVPLGYADPYDVLAPETAPLAYRVPQVLADPGVNPWLLRLAVERASGTAIGYANFHDRPDERGMVEIGYLVLPAFRRRGFAREMAAVLWSAAAAHPDVRVLRASVRPDNAPSRAIIEGAGLRHVGEQDDPEDGLEWVYELPVTEWAG